eukprot:TRINITY_DN110870_c0_g1_i1.p1 TRINITY_DN110870_c0_g1~~TRINITY_DN110870_c0_g1_i1.p1  ORF type:complete len:411 (+),score=96.06 TRINITY_DN110870_c0_g1_i1:58-1290(+)
MTSYQSMEPTPDGRVFSLASFSAGGLVASACVWALMATGNPSAQASLKGAISAAPVDHVALAAALPKDVPKDTVGGPGAPNAKQVVVGMDTNINLHAAWDNWDSWGKIMRPYWTEDMIYDFNYVGSWNFGATHGLKAWFDGEHMHFNRAIPDCQWQDFIRAATDTTCTSASYGLARWTGEFAGVPPPQDQPKVRIRDLDFYVIEGKKIKINWCIIDVVDMFEQVGYKVVPPSPLPQLGYLPPQAMDGFPAPISSMFTKEDAENSLKVWTAALREDYDLKTGTASQWAEDLIWYGPGGVGTARTRDEYITHFLKPIYAAFSDVERKTDQVVCEGPYCGAHFYLWGNHTGTWLGEKATYKRVPLRCGAHAHIVDGKIVEGWLIIDTPRTFHYMGIDFYGRAKELALAMAQKQ